MDLEPGLIEVYRNPTAQGYEVVRRFQWGQFLSLQAFPELDLAVDVILE